MALIGQLESAWYGSGRAPAWTRVAAGLYGAVIRLRAWLYRVGWKRSVLLPVPVLVIGNLSVGGTGKTPLAIEVAAVLKRHGYRPGVVSRGYGGNQVTPLLLRGVADPTQVGDEPCLIHASGVSVAVGRDRPAAALLLVNAGCDVVIADDGLQHYRLARDIEICVIDGIRRFGNGKLLPAGPLREPLTRLAQVDFRICNGGVAGQEEVLMQLRGDEAVALAEDQRRPLRDFANQRVHAIAAIGNPQRFFDSLRQHGLEVIEHAFADHHAFQLADIDFADGLPLLMTDKDAVKCQRFAQPHWWRVPVSAQLPPAFQEQLVARIADVVRLARVQ